MEYLFNDFNNEDIKDVVKIKEEFHNHKINLINKIKVHTNNIYKPHLKTNIMPHNLCDLIINESENYAKENSGWTKNRHNRYPTTDLPINLIKSIEQIVINFVVMNIYEIISKEYNLNKYFFGLNDLFIVKYEESDQTELEKHIDGSMSSFNILLNNKSDFEGGGTIMDTINGDELYELNKGDLLFHRGNHRHGGRKIISGKRYVLVGFLSYLKNIQTLPEHIPVPEPNHKPMSLSEISEVKDDGIDMKSWFIKLDTENEKNIDDLILGSKTLLLNTNKSNFNIIEKIVYELAMFHFNRLGIEYNSNDYFIEFWSKNEKISDNILLHNFHTDKDEHLFRDKRCLLHPILSTVTYINDNNIPTVITNRKQFNDKMDLEKNVILSFPNKFKHISFNGMYMHGVVNILNDININNRKTLMINLWKINKPTNVSYYLDDSIKNNFNLENKIILDVIENNNFISHPLDNNKNIINDLFNCNSNSNNLDYLKKILILLNIDINNIVYLS